MTPSDYAVEELALWEKALKDQRDAERQLAAAKSTRRLDHYRRLLRQVDALRIRAALLLAHAVEVKCAFNAVKDTPDSTQG